MRRRSLSLRARSKDKKDQKESQTQIRKHMRTTIPQRIYVLKQRKIAEATITRSQGRSLDVSQAARTNPGCIIPRAMRILALWSCRMCWLCSPFLARGRLYVG